jgi:hypothetical protein
MIRSYSELRRLDTFEERFKYLMLRGSVGSSTFGFDRWINQKFYTSNQWRKLRHHIIARDQGCDLGVKDHEIYDRIVIHHMNPMTFEDIAHGEGNILDPEFLITVAFKTHNAIHYGDERMLPKPHVARRSGDTKLW